MPKREHNCLYYADDKDIFDLLTGATKQLSKSKLFELARKRGIFISAEKTREELVKFLARHSHDWNQLEEILALTESPDRKEKMTSRQIKTEADISKIKKAIEDIKELRREVRQEKYQITEENGVVRVSIQYSDVDAKKNRLLQRQPKEMTIEAEKVGDEYRLRYNSNAKSNEIVGEIVRAIAATEQIQDTSISLAGIADPRARTKFFIDIMRGMKNFEPDDVLSLRVYRMNKEENEYLEEDDESDDGAGIVTSEDVALMGQVKSIALSGNQVHSSPEYRVFSEKNFYIVHFIWKGKETVGDKNCYEFEAEFRDQENATEFHYNVRGLYAFDTESATHKSARTPCLAFDQARLIKALEEAAGKAAKEAENFVETVTIDAPTKIVGTQ